MITLFLVNAKPLQYGVLRYDAKVYNFTTQGWDVLPTTGVPHEANLKAMAAVATVGPLTSQQIASVPDIVSAEGGVAFVTFTTSTDGSLHQADCINIIDLIDDRIRGGVSR